LFEKGLTVSGEQALGLSSLENRISGFSNIG